VEDLAGRRFEGVGEVRFVIESLELTEGTYKIDVAAHSIHLENPRKFTAAILEFLSSQR
jgi:pimeloyl-ACP methyl ester carboxylesterase